VEVAVVLLVVPVVVVEIIDIGSLLINRSRNGLLSGCCGQQRISMRLFYSQLITRRST
jgi:hypothetical protein